MTQSVTETALCTSCRTSWNATHTGVRACDCGNSNVVFEASVEIPEPLTTFKTEWIVDYVLDQPGKYPRVEFTVETEEEAQKYAADRLDARVWCRQVSAWSEVPLRSLTDGAKDPE